MLGMDPQPLIVPKRVKLRGSALVDIVQNYEEVAELLATSYEPHFMTTS